MNIACGAFEQRQWAALRIWSAQQAPGNEGHDTNRQQDENCLSFCGEDRTRSSSVDNASSEESRNCPDDDRFEQACGNPGKPASQQRETQRQHAQHNCHQDQLLGPPITANPCGQHRRNREDDRSQDCVVLRHFQMADDHQRRLDRQRHDHVDDRERPGLSSHFERDTGTAKRKLQPHRHQAHVVVTAVLRALYLPA